MLLCAVASTATAINRWVVAYRELARRDAAAALKPVAAPAADARPGAAALRLDPGEAPRERRARAVGAARRLAAQVSVAITGAWSLASWPLRALRSIVHAVQRSAIGRVAKM